MHVSAFKIFKTPICMCCSVCTIFAYCVSPKGTLTAFLFILSLLFAQENRAQNLKSAHVK